MSSHDIHTHVTAATDASHGEYDVAEIVQEIGDTYGYDIDPEAIDHDAYWDIVARHAV